MPTIRELMTTSVETVGPDGTAKDAAAYMLSADTGSIPVCDGDKIIGMITDRDIAVRAVAGGAACTSPVVEYISRDPHTARADDDLKTVLDAMGTKQIRRLPVLDKDDRLVGVVSLGDLSTRVKEKYAGEALEDISRP